MEGCRISDGVTWGYTVNPGRLPREADQRSPPSSLQINRSSIIRALGLTSMQGPTCSFNGQRLTPSKELQLQFLESVIVVLRAIHGTFITLSYFEVDKIS